MFNDDISDEVRTALVGLNDFRDHLIDLATSSASYDKLDDEERALMEKAKSKVSHSVGQLTHYISTLPYPSEQEHALQELWSALSYTFIIGSRAVRNPVADRLKKTETSDQLAEAREVAAESRGDSLVTSVVEEAAMASWAAHPDEARRPYITAKRIEVDVNTKLAALHGAGRVQFAKLERDTISGKVSKLIERQSDVTSDTQDG